MINLKKISFRLALLSVLIISLSACKGNQDSDESSKVKKLTLNKSSIELNDNNTTFISVNAEYEDNSSVDITDKVEWIVEDTSIISMNKNKIIADQEGETGLSAKYANQISEQILIKVYKEVNGYKLPLEPDETLNNSTLLGIDSNNNGVRDDVERWIFLDMEIYNGYPEIERAIAMQNAAAKQLSLVDFTNKDDKVVDAIAASFDCWVYYRSSRNISALASEHSKFLRTLDDKVFNTRERLDTYMRYDAGLSGRIFSLTPTYETKPQCLVDIDKL